MKVIRQRERSGEKARRKKEEHWSEKIFNNIFTIYLSIFGKE